MPLVVEFHAVVKNFHGLRPLRVADLRVAEGETVAISGVDAAAAEVFTSLLTGAAVPDEGAVRVFGEDTKTITDAAAWLAGLDPFGIVSDRVAVLDGLTVRQNIAIPLTLEWDPLPPAIDRVVSALAADAGLRGEVLEAPAGGTSGSDRFRLRLARALAGNPRLLIAEHPTASLPRVEVGPLAADFARLMRTRPVTVLLITEDAELARLLARRRLVLDPATGVLRRAGWCTWFS